MADALTNMLLTTYKRHCGFKEQRNMLLTDEQNDALTIALRNPAKSIRDIVSALQGAGFATSRDTIAKHRKGQCLECLTN